jgi:hypothetical protein
MSKYMMLMCVVVLVGCANTHNVLDMDGEGNLYKRTDTASVSRMRADGTLEAVHQGLAPGQSMMDATGVWTQMPGPFGSMAYNPQSGNMFLGSPKDVIIEGVEITPKPGAGQPSFKADKIAMNLSAPLEHQTAALTASLERLEGMTRAEAEAMVEKWKAAGEIAPTVADVLTAIIAAAF